MLVILKLDKMDTLPMHAATLDQFLLMVIDM